MFGIINFETFLIAGLILNLTPGADTMYILGRSISQGKKAGVLSALGISTGGLIHCLFAALGLSVILAKSAVAYTLIKFLGAAYLVYLGVNMFIKKPEQRGGEKIEKMNYWRIYLAGILTNVLNPKVALFFLAFLPQFIQHEQVQSPMPFLMLGLIFIATGTVWCLILALFASSLSNRIKNNLQVKHWLNRITGSAFIAIGVKMALSRD